MPAALLTHAFTASLKSPASGSIEYWDTKVSGLCLRVFASGAATWSFRYRPRNGGARQRITLGSLSDLKLADARDRAARLRVEVADGADPQGVRKKSRHAAQNVLTFDCLSQRYLDEYARPNKASWRNDELYLKRARAQFGEKAAHEVTRREVIDLLDEIRTTAPVSANRIHSVLGTMFNWAVEGELLNQNPIARMKKRHRGEKPKDRTLTDPEMRVLWHALEAGRGVSIDVADALRFILLTGQRPGETSGLVRGELRDLDRPDQARAELPAERMKARRPHVVPLAPMARDLLLSVMERRRTDGDGMSVFASRFVKRASLARHTLSQAMRRLVESLVGEPDAVESLRVAPPSPHDLRRTVASGLSRLGIPREDRKAVLAHIEGDVHGTVYDRYERLKEKRVALERWERHVAEVIGAAERADNVVALRGGRS